MKPYLLLVTCFVTILMISGSLVIAEDTPDELLLTTGTMILAAPQHYQAKKTPVAFSHSSHFKYSCKDCHHEWDRVSPVQGCATAGCHEQFWPTPPTGKPSADKKAISLTGAYHKACRGCHRIQKKENEALKKYGTPEQKAMPMVTGPIACEGCHPETQTVTEASLGSLSIPTGAMVLAAPEGSYTKRSSVGFPHSDHFDQPCMSCHHEWDGESEVQNCTTSGCHDQVEPDEKTRDINDPRNTQYYLTAYHKACLKCHRSLIEKRETLENSGASAEEVLPEFGPIRCSECHNEE